MAVAPSQRQVQPVRRYTQLGSRQQPIKLSSMVRQMGLRMVANLFFPVGVQLLIPSIVTPLHNALPSSGASAPPQSGTVSPGLWQNPLQTTPAALVSSDTPEPPLSPQSPQANGATIGASPATRSTMLFKRNSAQRRRALARTSALTDYEADLTSQDRAKAKAAVQRYLAETIKDDWAWEGPQTEEIEAPDELETASADAQEETWRPRDEWESDLSEGENGSELMTDGQDGTENMQSAILASLTNNESAVVDGPEVQNEITPLQQIRQDRKRRRRRRLADEASWNTGLDLFLQRRDAWTCARRLQRPRVRSPYVSRSQASTPAGDENAPDGWESDTEVPVARPLLPPANQMRQSIGPAAYNTIYDKVVVQQLTPICPLNLKDVVRSCVTGWQRDGQWPPPPSVPDPITKRTRSMSIASILGLQRPVEAGAAGAAGAAGGAGAAGAGTRAANREPERPTSKTKKKGLQKFWNFSI